MASLKQWVTWVHDGMDLKGFHEGRGAGRDDTLVRLALIHTEVSEATQVAKRDWPQDTWEERVQPPDIDIGRRDEMALELADVFIRLADLAGCLGIDLEEAVRVKMTKNMNRPDAYGTPGERARVTMFGGPGAEQPWDTDHKVELAVAAAVYKTNDDPDATGIKPRHYVFYVRDDGHTDILTDPPAGKTAAEAIRQAREMMATSKAKAVRVRQSRVLHQDGDWSKAAIAYGKAAPKEIEGVPGSVEPTLETPKGAMAAVSEDKADGDYDSQAEMDTTSGCCIPNCSVCDRNSGTGDLPPGPPVRLAARTAGFFRRLRMAVSRSYASK